MIVKVNSYKQTTGIFYFIGLILFFILHRWNDFFEELPLSVIIKVTGSLVLSSFIYWLISKIFLRTQGKAAIFTAISFFLFLFYDLVQQVAIFLQQAGLLITDKWLLILLLLICFVLVLLVKKQFPRLLFFIQTLLIILIIFEVAFLLHKRVTLKSVNRSFLPGNRNENMNHLPSVYLVVLDEYAGSETLQHHFNYPNTAFLNALDSLGFKVIQQARSNYHYTALSIASLLNGEYIKLPKDQPAYIDKSYRVSIRDIYHNKAFQTFGQLNYKVFNYSPFSIEKYPSAYTNRFLPVDYWLLLHPTIFDRLVEFLPYFLARKFQKNEQLESLFQKQVAVNYKAMEEVLANSKQQQQTFAYLHLMMPHAPFAVDSSGKINMEFLTLKTVNRQQKQAAYLQYLVHVNHKVLDFIRQLKRNTNDEAVILLLSDHGFRDMLSADDPFSKFNSLAAVYMPGVDKASWYNGMSNVNQLRVMFSALTKNRLPLLKDSLILK